MIIKYNLTAPLSHIGETASTGSLFQTVLTSNGKVPVITANSIRGQIRNCGAKHLLVTLNQKVDKEVFHMLFSGGNLSGTMKNDIEKAKKVRSQFPLVSLLGGGLGDMILQGKMTSTFAYPICRETEFITRIESEISWKQLMNEIEFTRTDDSKNDQLSSYIEDMNVEQSAKASTQMRYEVQYMAVGTEFWQNISLLDANELELGAFYTALNEWFKHPVLGGMSAKGFGAFNAETDEISVKDNIITISSKTKELISKYNEFLNESTFDFDLLKGAKPSGKKNNKTVGSDGDIS